jgi:DNA helicase HerA-like ATPase
MNTKANFIQEIQTAYTFKGASLEIGRASLNGECLSDSIIKLPLKSFNRHGLIAGATGTGKTKTLQLITEQLSENGVPVLLMDIKGDLSGLAKPGELSEKLQERCKLLKIDYQAKSFPVELLSLSEQKGLRLRSTVSEFGPVLFSKILNLNETQSSIISLIFKYCDDHKLALLDLKDLKAVLKFISEEGKSEIEAEYGKIASSSLGTILRKIIELESQGGEKFFGELSFETADLLKKDNNGNAYISIIRLADIQDKPNLFSCFMLSLLAEIYNKFPEAGDLEKPKLVLFIDEAHLLFEEASSQLIKQIETIVKLIRSKGVGIFFCTQNPQDIPTDILSQLGLKVQHALRAFTAKDRKSIEKAAENYPSSSYYKVDELLTSLGIGEALVSALDENGIPTTLVACLIKPPSSRMNILSEIEIAELVDKSELVKKYNQIIDRESAYEILNSKIHKEEIPPEAETQKPLQNKNKQEDNSLQNFFKDPIVRQVAKTAATTLTRGLLGMLLGGSTKRRR